MEPKINYFALLIVVIVGVAAGNLISNWITAKFIESEIEKVTAEISKSTTIKTNKAQQKIKKQPEKILAEDNVNKEQLMKQRKLDDNGIRLAKTCSEWKVAHKDMNTQTSERGMNKHCEQYEDYIYTGVLPSN